MHSAFQNLVGNSVAEEQMVQRLHCVLTVLNGEAFGGPAACNGPGEMCMHCVFQGW